MNLPPEVAATSLAMLSLWLLPGLFWGLLLVPVRDVIVRFVFGIGLSFTLVPTVALVLSAVAGDGISSTISIAAPILVFVSGLLLFLFSKNSGTSKRDEPIVGIERRVKNISLAVVLLAAGSRAFGGVVLHDWPFIRGGDIYSHVVMANRMLSGGEIAPYLVYPPGFHTMTAILSRLSGVAPLEVFPLLAPTLLMLPPLALYALGRIFGGWVCGVASALFGALVVNSSYLYFDDAMYPNMTSAQFLLPLAVAALILVFRLPSRRTVVLFALLGSSVVLYHPVGSLYAALLFALVGIFVLPILLLKDLRAGLSLLTSFALLVVLAVAFAWDTYDLYDVIPGDSQTGSGTEAVGMAVGTQAPLPLSHFADTLSLVAITLGFVGVLVVFVRGRGAGILDHLSGATVLLWTVVLFAGSRTSLSGFPERFERDLAIPLSLLAGYAVSEAISSVRERSGTAKVSGVMLLAVILCAISVQVCVNLTDSLEPAPKFVMTPGIREAGRWLEENNEGGNIMVAPHMNQVPSRAMLAMGGYSEYQSFTLTRIEQNRDLPPDGPEPLLDVLRVVYNPSHPMAREITTTRDVRYVVFYKRFDPQTTWGSEQPEDLWTSFEKRPDLYEVVFENQAVVIFDPKENRGRDD